MMENTIPTYDNFVRKLFNRSGDPSKDFTHAILGIVTEIHEYTNSTDAVNGLEELGDLTFYSVALRQVIEDYTGTLLVPTPMPNLRRAEFEKDKDKYFADESVYLMDVAKRWVGYGKVPADLNDLYNRVVQLADLANRSGKYPCDDFVKLSGSNMRKLLKRYPGGEFSQYHALVRDLGAEREALAADQ
jgi:hypothetical protein